MKRSVLIMAGLMLAPLLASLPASSQSASDSRDRGSRGDRDIEELLHGMDDRAGGGMGDRMGRHMQGGMAGGMGGGMAGGMGGGSRGAAFLLRSGDATVAVRCDPHDSMRACVEAAGMFMEKARSAASGGPAPATPPRP